MYLFEIDYTNRFVVVIIIIINEALTMHNAVI